MSDHDVTIIGCGLMGSALARQFAKSGFRVAAWNRTPERAEALAGDGVTPIRSVVDAVRSSRLVVAATLTYETTLAALDPVDSWDGTTLVNLAGGTPEAAADLERWATERGAEYLDGTIFCYPREIGSAEATIFFAGRPAVWSKHEQTLMTLAGASRHVSERVGIPNVLYIGMSTFLFGAMSAYVEGATYVLSQGVSAGLLGEITVPPLELLPYVTEETVAAIVSGDHETDQARIEGYAVLGRYCLDAIQTAGQHVRVFEAVVESLEAAEAAGLGELGFYSLTKVVGSADPAEATPHA